jgi:hypothetical protein
MNTETAVHDHKGNPLSEGAHVVAWHDGQWYSATVKEIKPHHSGCGDHRHIVLIRDGDRAEVQGYSDAVVVLPDHLWACGCLINDAGAHRVGCPDHPEGVRG